MKREFSLIDFVDRCNEALFYGTPFPAGLKNDLPNVLALQGQPGSYSGMFTLPPGDVTKEFHTFTGETVKSNAARRHIIGEEVCRILRLLEPTCPEVKNVGRLAVKNMSERIHEADAQRNTLIGIYCCGTCSCSFWRNLAVGNFDHREQRLQQAMGELKNCRLGNGRWRRFPFYYTLLALSELDLPAARAEITYALPIMERLLKRTGTDSRFEDRRHKLLTRLLTE